MQKICFCRAWLFGPAGIICSSQLLIRAQDVADDPAICWPGDECAEDHAQDDDEGKAGESSEAHEEQWQHGNSSGCSSAKDDHKGARQPGQINLAGRG